MNDDGEITLVSTAVSRLVDFLQDGMDIAAVEPNEQRGWVKVNTSSDGTDFILIVPDHEMNEYCIVGDNGFSVVARGVYSLGLVLAGIPGVRGRDDGARDINGWLFQKRMQKAMRLIAAAEHAGHNSSKVLRQVGWYALAHQAREMKPSSQTLACIAALVEEG